LTGLVERFKNGKIDFSTEIPTWMGQRSELSNFCSDLKDILKWKDSPFINQKEREAERE